MGHFPQFGLPLLAKELVELSLRKRTYQLRVVYAVILALVSCIVLTATVSLRKAFGFTLLGAGFPVLMWLDYLQRLGLHLALPVIACSAFTAEKERNTLGLLFLTRLSPWTILWEKFFSRILVAVSFLLISLPIVAFAYSVGGIEVEDLATQAYGLLLTSVKIVCVCLFCSAYFRTTTGALVASYLLVFSVGFVADTASLLLEIGYRPAATPLWMVLTPARLNSLLFEWPPMGVLGRTMIASGAFLKAVQNSVPTLLICALCLMLARRYLVSRAFTEAGSRLKRLFGAMDRWFTLVNNNAVTRGIVVVRPNNQLPADNPVAWRETTTRPLGQFRYIVRWLLVIELPASLLVICFPSFKLHRALVFGEWVVMTLIICVFSTGLVHRERRQQALDVLLTTTMSGSEIIRQKLAGLTRLMWICQAPIWTSLLIYSMGSHVPRRLEILINHVSMLLLYPPLIAWIGMWFGLRSKTATAAILKTIATCVIWCVVPLVLKLMLLRVIPITDSMMELRRWTKLGGLFSPAALFILPEFPHNNPMFDRLYPYGYPVAAFYSVQIYGLILYLIRKRCLDQADKLLGRVPQRTGVAVEEVTDEFEEQAVGVESVPGAVVTTV